MANELQLTIGCANKYCASEQGLLITEGLLVKLFFSREEKQNCSKDVFYESVALNFCHK